MSDDLDFIDSFYEQSCEAGGLVESVLGGLFEEELLAISDPRKVKAYQCTRRAGKTHTQAVDAFVCSELNPDGESMCVSLTAGHCQATIGNAFERLKRDYGLPISEHQRKGLLYWLNERTNHKIWLRGCKDFKEAEKLRGDFLYGAWIDEAQSVPLEVHPVHIKTLLEYLVEDVLSPRLLDKNGKLVLSGTPGPLLAGYFWEVTTGEGTRPRWPGTHRWSMMDNPFLADAAAWVEERKVTFGWREDSPGYQREILGRWVYDPDALIYRYEAARNHTDCGQWPGCIDRIITMWGSDLRWILGSDVGHNDATTFVLTVSRPGAPHVLFVRAWGGSEMLTTQRAAELLRVKALLAERGQHLSSIEMDPGGGGKILAHDLTGTFGIAVNPAEKTQKGAAVRALQSAIISGNAQFNAVECQPLLGEMSVLPWDKGRTNHHGEYPDDYCDGGVYAYRRHPTYERWVKELPAAGTVEAINLQAAQYKEQAMRATQVMASGLSRSQQRRELARIGWPSGRTRQR